MHRSPLSPCDLYASFSGDVIVAGRLSEVRPQQLRISDALASVGVTLVSAADPLPTTGDLAIVEGRMTDGALIDARIVRIISSSDGPMVETGRLHLEGVAHNLARRAAVMADVRRFFDARAYLEVETPLMVPSPGLDLHLDAFEVDGGAYLITSPEYQMKRLLAGGLPRIFQFARCFRRGERGTRHNPEFTMLEWYRAHTSMEAMMDETEALVRELLERYAEPDHLPLCGRACRFDKPFVRMTVAEAFRRFADADVHALDDDRYFLMLVDAVEPAIGALGVPTFLHDYLARHASLAQRRDDDPSVCERFELYVGDVELCNGFGELTCPHEQRARFAADRDARRAHDKPVYPVDERFLAALGEGMPPAAGNAMGMDRLVALCSGAARIDDVMTFPASWL
jgi:lysyl-tRNA synthetase class 2